MSWTDLHPFIQEAGNTTLAVAALCMLVLLIRRPFAERFGAKAAYALWLYRRVVFGEMIKESLKSITDMDLRERALFVPLVAGTLILGVYPSLVTDIIGPSVQNLLSSYDTALLEAGTSMQVAEH